MLCILCKSMHVDTFPYTFIDCALYADKLHNYHNIGIHLFVPMCVGIEVMSFGLGSQGQRQCTQYRNILSSQPAGRENTQSCLKFYFLGVQHAGSPLPPEMNMGTCIYGIYRGHCLNAYQVYGQLSYALYQQVNCNCTTGCLNGQATSGRMHSETRINTTLVWQLLLHSRPPN